MRTDASRSYVGVGVGDAVIQVTKEKDMVKFVGQIDDVIQLLETHVAHFSFHNVTVVLVASVSSLNNYLTWNHTTIVLITVTFAGSRGARNSCSTLC